ncbi:hypothetical protein [Rhinopithecimicrobium faecis]
MTHSGSSPMDIPEPFSAANVKRAFSYAVRVTERFHVQCLGIEVL